MTSAKPKNISISTLGIFDIYLNDKSILHYFGNSKKTLLLFKYFVGNVDEKVYTNKIMESVFSQYKYQDPSNTLRGHIHRLRGILNKINEECGADLLHIEYLADHYIFVVDKSCSVDYLEFTEEVKKKPTIDKVGQKRAETIKQLYKGEFMPDDAASEWTAPIRINFAKQFGKYINAYLACYYDAEKYQELVEEVDSILEKVLFEEDIQAMYIRALIKMNKNKQAMTHYEYLVQRYETENLAEPSDKIRSATKSLTEKTSALESIDLFEVEKMVRKAEIGAQSGAFICNKDFFFELFRLMIRQKARDQRYFFVGIAGISASDFRDMSADEMHQMQTEVKNLIAGTVRAQDAVSRISNTQVGFMLFDALEGTVERIGLRMKEALAKLEKRHNLVVTITYKSIIHEKEYSGESTL